MAQNRPLMLGRPNVCFGSLADIVASPREKSARCPLHPRKRTCPVHRGMYAFDQKRTSQEHRSLLQSSIAITCVQLLERERRRRVGATGAHGIVYGCSI